MNNPAIKGIITPIITPMNHIEVSQQSCYRYCDCRNSQLWLNALCYGEGCRQNGT